MRIAAKLTEEQRRVLRRVTDGQLAQRLRQVIRSARLILDDEAAP